MESTEELERLLVSTETDRVEKTISRNKTDKFCEAICAFANDLPGHSLPGFLFIGARSNGAADGEAISEELLTNLGDLRSNGNIQPMVSLTVHRLRLNGGDMAVVRVLPSDLPPVRYKQEVWIRSGPRRCRANEQDERVLIERRVHRARTFDALPCLEASLEDLSLTLFRETYRPAAISAEVIEENHRPIEHQLGSLRFWDHRAMCPTHAGVLLFGKDPVFFLPGAYVHYVRYSGTSIGEDVAEERRISGSLLSVLDSADRLAAALPRSRPVTITAGGREQLRADFPTVALRELFMNAIIHRDWSSNTPVRITQYDDRIEVLNPGGLFGGLRRDELRMGTSAYRNPVIAEAARVLGYVNRYGRGLSRADAALANNGSPPLQVETTEGWFLATVRAPS